MKPTALTFGLLTLLVGLLIAAGVHAGLPMDQTRATIEQVLEILNNPELKSNSAKEERRSRLRQVIYPCFDFAEMARRSLGSTWQKISPGEQQEFLKLFTRLLEESYVSNIESYSGERVLYGREIEEKKFAEVDTKIITNRGEEFTINYKLHELNGDWRVYDVVIEDVSIVNNYRSQFNSLLAKCSFAESLERIRERLAAPR